MQHQIQYGIDIFLQQASKYINKRIGFVTNNAAATYTGILSKVALLQAGFTVTKLFGPEHGITLTGDDGAVQHNSYDEITGLPVISLYGEKMQPSKEDLEDIDLVVFDIPDVGCRFYTYLWTMTYIMEACTKYDKPFIILDRPNPTGATLTNAEGPMLDETHCSSFIGRWSIPINHCCTLGELALYFAAVKMPQLKVDVVKVENYLRHQTALNDFEFIPTSPAIQNIQTAMLYPGMGLLEGVNINEGRGTATPFCICGAPFINEKELLKQLLFQNIPGIKITSCTYIPQNGMYENLLCHGVQFTVTDAAIIQPVAMGIALLQTLLQLYPDKINERLYATAANPGGSGHLDKLLGINHAFTKLKNGSIIKTQVADEWYACIKACLLY